MKSYFKWGFFVLVVIAFLVLVFVGVNSKPTQVDKLDILAIIPLSGVAADTGTLVLQGMSLAVEDIAKDDNSINFIAEDSQSDKAYAVSAYNSKVNNNIDVAIVVLSSIGMAVSPLAEDKNIPLIGTVVTASAFTKDKDWTYRFFADSKIEGEAILADIELLDVNSVGIIYLNDEYGNSTKDVLVEGLENASLESFNSDTLDYRSQITKLKDKDALVIIGFAAHLKTMYTQIKELGYKGKVISTGAFATRDMVKFLDKEDVVYLGATELFRENNLHGKEFLEKFRSKYGKEADHYAAIGYDLIMYLHELTKDSKEISPAQVKEKLDQRISYAGLVGNIVANGNSIEYNLVPAKIEHNKIVYID